MPPPRETPPLPWAPGAFPDLPERAATATLQAALGKALFYDPVVSGDRQTACVTCHSEEWGMSDGLPQSIGQGAGLLAGPGRRGPNVVRRNSQTLWNVAYRETLFWDGRASSLEDQVHFPFAAAAELGRSMADVLADLRAAPEYVRLFGLAFPEDADPFTISHVATAIAEFERTLTSRRAVYDSYVLGDAAALSEPQLRGMSLFAEARCASCHVPPLFASERYADRGVPPLPGVTDDGRFETTQVEADRGTFKVPTLRNTRDTGPYFHTGGTLLLRDAVRHEADFSASEDGTRTLTDSEIDDVTTFIRQALLDSSRIPTRPRKVPSGLQLPIDGFDIRR